MTRILPLILLLILQGCASTASESRPESYYSDAMSESQESILNDRVTDEDDQKIKELLYYRVTLPKQNRIAILKLSRDNYWRFYSNDFTELTDSLAENLVGKLRSSDRVYDASFLPAMLVPERRTIPALREAAARFQADLLLAYRTLCDSYQKYRFISPDETKSYCSVEAVLLDTRSGIIAKSMVSTENFKAVQNKEDTNFSETIKKAEMEATAKALGYIADEVSLYMSSVPVAEN